MIASICHAGWVPVSAGILKGKRATCVSAIKDDLINAGAIYLDEPVVIDGKLVTSRTPADLPASLPAIIEALAAWRLWSADRSASSARAVPSAPACGQVLGGSDAHRLLSVRSSSA